MSRATREVRLGSADIRVETRGDGSILVRCPQPLGPYPARLTERLEHWAAAAPHRVFIAQRAGYGDARQPATRLGDRVRADEI